MDSWKGLIPTSSVTRKTGYERRRFIRQDAHFKDLLDVRYIQKA
jgi:hypothetical protein